MMELQPPAVTGNRSMAPSGRQQSHPPAERVLECCDPIRTATKAADAAPMPAQQPDGFAGLHVGLVGPVPPPAGGMANQTRQLAELLRAAGAEVHMVSTNPAYRPAWLGRLPVLRAGARLLPYLLAVWRVAGSCELLHVMANSGWSWHLFALPPLLIGRLRGTPVLINYRGGEAAGFLARSHRLVRGPMSLAACLAVPSGFLAEVFARHGMSARLLPNIVDLSRFHPTPGAPIASGSRLVVARNLEPIYDIATAIRAFALVRAAVPAATLTIAGSGPDKDALVQLCQELDVEPAVRFAGRLDREQMAGLYRAADLSLNPSLADNMPNSVLESLASGVPVVSTNVGGVPFLLEHGRTGLLVPPGQPQAMAEAVLSLLCDAPRAGRLRAAGLVEVQRYTWARVAPVLAALYRDALTQQGRNRVPASN